MKRFHFFILIVGLIFSLSFSARKLSLIGNEINDFQLKNTDGRIVSLSSYPKAKGFMIVFTCNHCPFAKLYTERFNQLNLKYKDLQVPLLAINSMDTFVYEEESYELMCQKAKEENYNFPYLYDAMQNVGKNFHAEHTPHAFVIWKEADRWIIRYSGSVDDNGEHPELAHSTMKNAVDDLLVNRSVAIPETASFGCAIFYRK
jgi:peroxiredoxin